MKYLSLHVFILTGASLFLSGCYHDYDYDVTRSHDIYRMNYKYTPPPQLAPDSTVPTPTPSGVAVPPPPPPAGTAPGTAQPAVPAAQ